MLREKTKSTTPAFAWGYNNLAALGLGHTARVHRPTPTRLPGGTIDVQGGINYSVALTRDGDLYSWGGNQYGQLGLGDTTTRREPALVPLPPKTTVTAIACGTDHVLALTDGGKVFAWGRNHRGQVGVGSTADQHSPAQVIGRGTVSIGAGNGISAATTRSGGLQVWGRNSFGQLAVPAIASSGATQGAYAHQLEPAAALLPTGTNAKLVDAGQRHLAVITSDGRLLQYGLDAYGRPQSGEIELKSSWGWIVQVCAGDDFTLVRTSSDKLLAVGNNSEGQLGLGHRTHRTALAEVRLPRARGKVVDIWAGARSALAITDADEVYTWGDSQFGQAGLGDVARKDTQPHHTPTKLAGLSNARVINASGGAHHVFLIADGAAVEHTVRAATPGTHKITAKARQLPGTTTLTIKNGK